MSSYPEVAGYQFIDSPIGAANHTWIIRWESNTARDVGLKTTVKSEKWQAVRAEHPDPAGYLQMSARFMDEM